MRRGGRGIVRVERDVCVLCLKCESRGWRSSAKHQSFSFTLHGGAPLKLNATTKTAGLGLG